MIKNIFRAALAAVLFTLCFSAEAQQQAKLAKLGWLYSNSRSSAGSGTELFWQEFGKLGYVEGKNIASEYRSAEGKLDRLPALADELVRLNVDVLIAGGTPTALALKNATRTIPIVFYGVGDPVATGLIDSLARPGGNITGFTIISPVLAGKRLELLKETVPKLSRVAVLWDPQNAGSVQIWEESQPRARELGLQLHSLKVNSADKLESGFKDAVKAGSGALAGTSGALLGSLQKHIISLAAKNRLPAIYTRAVAVANGGLMSYGPDEIEPYQRAAVMVDKILKGTKPADIPVEQPTKFEMMINLKTAKALGLTIPPVVLMRAEKIIK